MTYAKNTMNYAKYVNEVKLSPVAKRSKLLIERFQRLEFIWGDKASRLLNGAIGMTAEAIEVLSAKDKDEYFNELGDVLFYIHVTAWALDIEDPFKGFEDQDYTGHYSRNFMMRERDINLVVMTGKYLDLVKKVIFQGKAYDAVTLRNSLYEICTEFFLTVGMLEMTIEDVENINREKLDKRYKEAFSVNESEKRE
jgi:NTP pyrophosphatase (non-canonical NTP hydrolase)